MSLFQQRHGININPNPPSNAVSAMLDDDNTTPPRPNAPLNAVSVVLDDDKTTPPSQTYDEKAVVVIRRPSTSATDPSANTMINTTTRAAAVPIKSRITTKYGSKYEK